MQKTTFILLFTAAFLALAPGCAKVPPRPDGMPELAPCTIAATFGSERLQDVGVMLTPKGSSDAGWSAGGRTDAEGKAIMKTAAHYDGVVPGEYYVVFQKYAEPEHGPDGMPLPAQTLVPLKYSRGDSLATVKVTKEQREYLFELDGI